MFKNFGLGIKIGGGFGIVLLLLGGISVVCLTGMNSILGSLDRNDVATQIVENVQYAMIAGKNFVIKKDQSFADEVEKYMGLNIVLASDLVKKVKDPTNIDRLEKVIAASDDYRKFFNDYVEAELSKQNEIALVEKAVESIQNDFDRLERAGTARADIDRLKIGFYEARIYADQYHLYQEAKYLNEMSLTVRSSLDFLATLEKSVKSQNERAILQRIRAEIANFSEAEASYETTMTAQLDYQSQAVSASQTAIANAKEISQIGGDLVHSTYDQAVVTTLLIGVLSLAFGVLLSLFLTKSITTAMRKGVTFAEKVASGDLTFATGISQKDEIGRLAAALDDMRLKLQTIVYHIDSATQQVSSGSQQLSSTAQQMAQGATEQAASVEEISASMEQMSANIKQNSENASTTEAIAKKSAEMAEEGGKAVIRTVEAMKLIASKIGIIGEIARSTNMLSLNASIEAARAGEFGKGFAVVAAEVGKLAERSQKEAGEISALSIESVQIAESAGQTILSMIPEITKTAELTQEINASSREQNFGAEQINKAINQLNLVVQQNASASEESASMSEELASQADSMQDTMSYFTLSAANNVSESAEKNHFERTGQINNARRPHNGSVARIGALREENNRSEKLEEETESGFGEF